MSDMAPYEKIEDRRSESDGEARPPRPTKTDKNGTLLDDRGETLKIVTAPTKAHGQYL